MVCLEHEGVSVCAQWSIKTKWLNIPCREQIMDIFPGCGKEENVVVPAELALNNNN